MRRRSASLLIWLTAAGLLVGLGACTSDESNPVGAGLGQVAVDSLMRELVIDDLVHLGQLDITDPADPLDEADVLYLGERQGDASSILVNYDFSFLSHPDSAALVELLTDENVDLAEIKFIILNWYGPDHDLSQEEASDLREWNGALKNYDVHLLDAPFDTLSYPGFEPSFAPDTLETESASAVAGEFYLRIGKERVVQWIQDRARVGLIIREGAGSEPGLLGFTSKENLFPASTLPLESEGTNLGPALRLRLNTTPANWPNDGQFLVIPPAADVSTWHQLTETSLDASDRIELRGHLRSYPVIRFDPAVLEPGLRINYAEVVLQVDTLNTTGPIGTLTISEFPLDMAPDATRTGVILDDIDPAAELVGGGVVAPEHATEHELRLNVTTSLQRYINGVQDENTGYLIALGERFFRGFVDSPGPSFYYRRWSFYGTGAGPDLRPRLEILYTRVDDLVDGEAR
jgi:hypothetical protein